MFTRLKKVYFPFSINYLKTQFAYRFTMLFFVAGRIVQITATMLLWVAIYENSPNPVMNGFSSGEMINYLFLTSVIGWVTGSGAAHQIAREVRQGTIAMHLIKPISFQGYLFFMDLGNIMFSFVIMMIPFSIAFYLIAYFVLGVVSVTATGLLLGIISIILGYFTMYFFDMCFGFLSFYTQYMFGLFQVKTAVVLFLSGALVPFTFFPDNIEKIMKFSPFATIGYVPALMIMGKFESDIVPTLLLSQVIWLVVFGLLSLLVWKHAIKRMVVLGG